MIRQAVFSSKEHHDALLIMSQLVLQIYRWWSYTYSIFYRIFSRLSDICPGIQYSVFIQSYNLWQSSILEGWPWRKGLRMTLLIWVDLTIYSYVMQKPLRLKYEFMFIVITQKIWFIRIWFFLFFCGDG